MNTPSVKSADLSDAMVRGTFWALLSRWAVRLIGLVSTIVIARILTPADYGLIAMVALVTGLIETFLDADASTALLRSPTREKDYVDTAWTLKFLQAIWVSSVVAISAPFAARYFHEPRLTGLLWAYCVATSIAGLGSVSPILARKDLDFYFEVKLGLLQRIIAFVATVALALALKSYWALALGPFVGMAAGFVLAYAWHPYRPRFCLRHVRELFGFSQWMLLSGIGLFFARKLDGFIVGRISTTAELGAYNVSLELGQMVSMELGAPLNRALLPVLANMHDDPDRMARAVMKTVAAINTLTLPAGIGMAMVAPLAVEVLLGKQWLAAIPLLAIFATIGSIRFMTGPYYTMLMTLGHSRLLAYLSWLELVVFGVAALLLSRYGVLAIAEARVISTFLIGGVWLLVGARYGLHASTFVRAITRPLLASLVMALALYVTPDIGGPVLVRLIFEILVGAAAYGLALSALWAAMGRPDGIERMALHKADDVYRRMRAPAL